MSKDTDYHLGILERSFDDGMYGRRSVEFLRQYIAQLEAGQKWEPVDTEIICACEIACCHTMLRVNGDTLEIEGDDGDLLSITLPGDICLMHYRP